MERKEKAVSGMIKTALLVMVMVFLAGCGKKTELPEKTREEEIPDARCYRKVERELDISGYSVFAGEIQVADDNCYFIHMKNAVDEEENWNAERSLMCMNLKTGEADCIVSFRNVTVNAFCVNSLPGQESIVAVSHDFDEYVYTLSEYSMDGKLLKEVKLDDQYSGYWIRKLPDGNYLSGDSSSLCFVGADGGCEKAGEEFRKSQYGSCVVTEEGKVYITYHEPLEEEAGVAEIDFRNRTIAEVGRIPGKGEVLTCYGERDFLCMDQKGIYLFDTDRKEAECMIDLSMISGIVMDRIRGLQWFDNQVSGISWNYWMAGENAQIFSFEKMTDQEVAEREKLMREDNFDDLGRQYVILYGYEEIFKLMLGQNLINEFNLQSQEYHVIFKDLEETDSILVSEDCPDLMYLFWPTDIEDYYQSGVLEDLMPYMEKSEVLYPENIQDFVYNAFGFDGGLYALTRTGTLETFMMRQSQAVGTDGWTVDEFLTLLEEHPDILCTSQLWTEGILDTILKGNIDAYVDFEKGEVFFNTPEFCRTLERIRELKLNDRVFHYWEGVEEEDLQKIFLLNEWQSNADRIGFLERIFQEKVVELGLPNDGGNSQAVLNMSDAYMMLKNGKCKAGAFAFLEYLMSYNSRSCYSEEEIAEYERQGISHGSGEMFGLKSLYEYSSKAALGKQRVEMGAADRNGQIQSMGIVEYEITEEHERMLMDALTGAKADPLINQQIRDIVKEEAAYFFERQKPVESVCSIIQNRVKLMINENM